jgi:gliding motility-associated-like protein
VGKIFEEINPDYIHIATEGPVGLCVRQYLDKHSYRYNTAYHTKFPEGIRKLFGIPEAFTWPLVRWFHKHSGKVLTTTDTMVKELQDHGFDGDIISWTRGVDRDVFNPTHRVETVSKYLLCVSRVSKEKNLEAFFELDSTFKPVWTLKNLSQNADQYRWVIRKANGTDTQFNTATLAEWPIIRAEDPGKYTICLEASIGFCKDTVCREINVLGEDEPFIYLANVFTPGSKDGLNDEFKVVSLGLISYSIKVYNRWGALVFKSTDVSESWNGKVQNQGENCPAGNYFYILDYQLQGQPKKNVNGVVNLIR